LLGGVAWFLWHADQAPLSVSAVWLAALCAALWAVGAVLQGRITVPQVLLIEAAALAAASAATGLRDLHLVFKPLAMVLAIACVLQRGLGGRFEALLVAALAFSLAGDVFLMLPDLFIPGLASFLLAHVCYIALFRQGLPWFPSGKALVGTLAAGAVMYAFLFPTLGPVLKVAVAAYTLVIALMAAQAIGRAMLLRDGRSVAVAAGALFFMASDSLLAVNKFAMPLPMAQFAVLSTYYVAQVLIALNVRAPEAGVRFAQPSLREAATQ
jgi:alkylglycerol monooxygenase